MKLPTLSEEDKSNCESDLVFWSSTSKNLSTTRFTEAYILKMIAYELLTRQRKTALNRLHGRLTRLRRSREWGELLERIGN